MRADSPVDATTAASRVGVLRVEASLGVAVSVFGAAVAVMALPTMVGQWEHLVCPLGMVLVVLVYGSILASGVTAVLRKYMRFVFGLQAFAFLIALAIWQSAIVTPLRPGDSPWVLMMLNLSEAYVLIARRDWIVPAMYGLLTCVLAVTLQLTPAGGSAPVHTALLDGVAGLLIDAALVILTIAIRHAALGVDAAQGKALRRYGRVQSDHAVEIERVQVDALVHDRVLTTFLAAAHAHDAAAQRLAAQMAADTIDQLAAADSAAVVLPNATLAEIAARIRSETGALSALFTVRAIEPTERTVPGRVAEAVVAAVVQAMVNSANHAGDASVSRWVRLSIDDDGRLQAVVGDRGAGFDVNRIGAERLGVRVSITERLSTVGGRATVASAPGRGTRITLVWPDPDGAVVPPRVVRRAPEPAVAT